MYFNVVDFMEVMIVQGGYTKPRLHIHLLVGVKKEEQN